MGTSDFLYNLLQGNSNLEYIEILGYKIYLDDLLLLSIIFCLYQEGVEDGLLLMCLILLLFS